MPAPTVRLKIRVKLPNGSRAYLDPVFSSNSKLQPLYALVDGKPQHHPEGVYHLRYLKGGNRVWESVGNDPQVALTAQLRVEHGVQAVALGLAAPDLVVLEKGKTDLAAVIAEYLNDIASARSKATLSAYTHTLRKLCAGY